MSASQCMTLDQLIQQRRSEKREHLRKKLSEQIKIISDQTKSEANLESDHDSFGRLKQNGIWEKVLSYFTDPLDIKNAYFACATFATILNEDGEKRLAMLLPETLEILYMRKYGSIDSLKVERRKENALKRRRNLFELRLVSKSWKMAIDGLLFEPRFSDDSWFLHVEKEDVGRDIPRSCVFDQLETIHRARTTLSKEYPEFSSQMIRKLFLNENNSDFWHHSYQFTRRVQGFFNYHIKSVWFFQYEWNCRRHPERVAGAYKRLVEILKRMPNVKALVLKCFVLSKPGEIRELHRTARHYSFPVLDSLQHFDCMEVMDDPFLGFIFENCRNLKSVALHPMQTCNEMCSELKSLNLESFDGGFHFLQHHSWALKKITVELTGETAKASVLFPVLNQFSKTLQHLHIRKSMIEIDNSSIHLDLPNLKSFRYLFGIGHQDTLNFDTLLPLSRLEKVVVWCVNEENSEKAKVKILRYLEKGNMDESNVWDCFPYLKCLQFQRDELNYNRQLATRKRPVAVVRPRPSRIPRLISGNKSATFKFNVCAPNLSTRKCPVLGLPPSKIPQLISRNKSATVKSKSQV